MGSIQLGSVQLEIVLAVAAVLSLAGVVLVSVQGDDAGDVVAAPTTVDAPESLAFDDSDPDSMIGDDATWMSADGEPTNDETEATSDSLVSSTTVPGGGTPAAIDGDAETNGAAGAGSSPTTARPGSAAPTTTRPTTAPTTVAPTRAAPTTAAPTTAAPTTAAPTTAAPTTAAPTTPRHPTVGFSGIAVGDFTNSNANISQNGQDGSFRTVCTVSHFNFDDAIVFPGQRAATHLHMYFGNLLADFSSTGASLAASGDATCQGLSPVVSSFPAVHPASS